jgi:hypothetical protein
LEDFPNGCELLRQTCAYDPQATVAALADEMDQMIDQQNICIDIIAGGVYVGQQTTRDEAVTGTQAWRLAFSDEGKTFALSKGFTGNMLRLVEWLGKNYPHKFRSDPIPSWEKQAARLCANKNPHIALKAISM